MKKIMTACLAALLLLTATACHADSPIQTENSETTTVQTEPATSATSETTLATEPPAAEPIVIAQGSVAKLDIVMPAEADNNTVYAKDKLFYFIKNTAGAELACGTGAGSEYELLLGDTGREESTALKATLTGDSYAVKVDGDQIVVVATNAAFLYDAVSYLTEELLVVEGDTVSLNVTVIDHVEQGDTTSLRYLFTQSKVLYPDESKSGMPVEVIQKTDDTQYPQGGCTDGTYIYQGFIYKDTANNEKGNRCRIVKIKPDFDRKTQTVEMISGVLDLNHTNDLTYNPKTHELFVVHNNPYRTKLTVIDPDTLTVKRTVTIKQNVYSISYNPERDVYVVGMSGGQNMILFDGELANTVSRVYPATQDTNGYTTQGICSDDTFIYHTLWNSPGSTSEYNRNVITVYDWYGNYVGMIRTKINNETENIFVYDDVLYVNTYSSSAKAAYMYRIDAVVKP